VTYTKAPPLCHSTRRRHPRHRADRIEAIPSSSKGACKRVCVGYYLAYQGTMMQPNQCPRRWLLESIGVEDQLPSPLACRCRASTVYPCPAPNVWGGLDRRPDRFRNRVVCPVVLTPFPSTHTTHPYTGESASCRHGTLRQQQWRRLGACPIYREPPFALPSPSSPSSSSC
jgi:hypothetical protein